MSTRMGEVFWMTYDPGGLHDPVHPETPRHQHGGTVRCLSLMSPYFPNGINFKTNLNGQTRGEHERRHPNVSEWCKVPEHPLELLLHLKRPHAHEEEQRNLPAL